MTAPRPGEPRNDETPLPATGVRGAATLAPGIVVARRDATCRALGYAAVLGAAATAQVGADAARWFGMRGPQCLVGACLDPIGCPACGLVRSVASAVQGDLAGSFRFHAGGPLITAIFLVGLAVDARTAATPRALPALGAVRKWLFRSFLAAVFGGWALRIVSNPSFSLQLP